MPELPEVETVVRSLRPGLVGRTIVNLRVGQKKLRRPWSKKWTPHVVGQRITGVSRRGKWIVIEVGSARLLMHLGMTGQLLIAPADKSVAPHTHLWFDLNDKRQLRFRDERRFGSADVFATADELTAFLNARLGPEPFDLDPKYWRAALQATQRPIKAALLDQAIIAGVGNIYADESLFVARIHPTTPGRSLTARQATRLQAAVAKVLSFAIECRGSSIRNDLDGTGERGSYQDEFRVYGRFGEPCRTCRRPIERIRLAGRSTHFCPKCQASIR